MTAVQAIVDGFNMIDAKLRQRGKGGCMAAVVFLIQDQLVVATAGSPMVVIDSGSDIVQVVHPALASCIFPLQVSWKLNVVQVAVMS